MMGDNTVEGVAFCPAEIADPSLLETYDDKWDEFGPNAIYPSLHPFTVNLSLHYDPCLITYARKAKDYYFGESLDSEDILSYVPVSYTHLTLPTNREV